MRAGKGAIGLAKSNWLDYCKLPEAIAYRIFAIFDEDGDGVLTESEFATNLTKTFISDLDYKLELSFKIFDSGNKGRINEEDVRHILMHCSFEGILEDTDVSGDSSPKEGKYSSQLNSYMSFINRHNQQKEINILISEVF